MNDDEPLSDLEERLRAWRPAEMPAELRARLWSARPARRRQSLFLRPALAAAMCALVVGTALLLNGHFASTPRVDDSSAVTFPGPQHTDDPETAVPSRWLLGESLTMNIYTGVPPGTVPAALRLDGDFAGSSGLIPVRSPDGKLPLKVDCQF